MAKVQSEMATRITVDSIGAVKSYKALTSAVKASMNAWKASEVQLKSAGDYQEAAKAKVEGLTKSIDLQKGKLTELKARQQDVDKSTKEGQEAYFKLDNQIASASKQLGNYEGQLKRAKNSLTYYVSGLADLQKGYKQNSALSKSYVERLEAEGKQEDANKARLSGLKQSYVNIQAQYKVQLNELEEIRKSSGATSDAYKRQQVRVNETATAMNRAKNNLQHYTSGLADLQNSYKQSAALSKSYVERLEAEGKQAEAGKAKISGLKKSYANLYDQLKLQKAELAKVVSESGVASEKYAKQKVKVEQTTAAMAKQKSEVAKLTVKYGTMSDKMAKLSDKAALVKDRFRTVATGFKSIATAASVGIAGVTAASVAGAEKASTLQNIYKQNQNLLVTAGDSAKSAIKAVTEMQKDGQKYSVKYGLSQKEIAEQYQDLIKRGHTAKESLAVMKTELQASVAAGDDFRDVVKVSSQVIEAFGMKTNNTGKMVKNTKRVVNDLAYAADTTATDFSSLGKGMEYVGDSANNAGFSLEETSAALGELSNHGLEADKAGTGLRKMITSLASPSDNAVGALKKIGITSTKVFQKSNGDFKSMSDIMAIMEKHTKNLGGAQKAAVFKAVFGATGMQAAQILAVNNKELSSLTDKITKAGEAGDYVQKLANKNSSTAQMNVKRFKEAGKALEIMMGSKLLPTMTEAANDMTKAFNNKSTQKGLIFLINGVKNFLDGVLKVIEFMGNHTKTVTAFGAALGGIWALAKVNKFIKLIKEMRTNFGLVNDTVKNQSIVRTVEAETAAISAQNDVLATNNELESGAGLEAVGTREEYKVAKKSRSKMSVLKRMARGKTTAEDAEAISSRIGKIGTTGSKMGKLARGAGGLLKRVPWLRTGLAAMNLIGINKKNAGQKVGSTAGQLGGTIGGGAIGTGIGGLVGGGLGTFLGPAGTVTGAEIGSTVGGLAGSFFGGSKGQDWGGKLGKKIQKSMKHFKMPKMSTIKKSIGDWFGGIGKWIGKLKLPSIHFGKMFKGFKMPNIGKMFKNFKMPKISGIGKWFSGLFKGLKIPSLSSLGKSIGSAFGKMFSRLGKTGIGKSISKMLGGIGKTMSGWAKGIGKFFAPAVKAIQAPFEKVGKWFKTSPFGKSIITLGKDIAGVVKGVYKLGAALGAIIIRLGAIGLAKVFQKIGSAVKDMGKLFTNVGKTISKWAKNVRKTIDNMVKPIQKTMNKIGKGISNAWHGTLKNVTKFVKNIYHTATRWIGKLLSPLAKVWHSISKTAGRWWKNISGTVGRWVHNLYKTATKWIGRLLSPVAKAWQSISRTAGRWWKSISSAIGNWVHKIYKHVTKWFRNLLSPIARVWKSISNTIGGWIKGIWKNISKFGSNMASFFKKLPRRISGALKGAWHGIWNAMAGIVNNGIIHPVVKGWNAVAGAINGVEKKIGVGKSFRLGTASYGSAKLSTYAKGTSGGPALVNDAKSKYWREAYKLPDGRIGMFPNKRNIIVNLPKGTEIAKGEDARMVQPYLEHNGGKIPAFASATGWLSGIGSAIGSAVHGVGNWFSGVKTKASKLIDNLGKMIKSPAKYLSAMIASPLNALAKGGGIAAKAVGMTGDIVIHSLTSWFKKMLKAGQDEQLVGNVKLGGSVASRACALAKAFKQGYPASNIGGIAGILGNWIQESNLNPSAVNASDHGTGLGQWTFTRETGLRNWLRRHGYAWNSAAGQIGYALNEPGVNGMLKAVLRMTNPTAAAQRFFATWESGGNMDASGGARLSNASAVYRYIRGMENGGLVDKDQIIRIAEHNKPEMVLPLTNKSRANQLISQASQVVNGDTGTQVASTDSESNEKLDKLISLMSAILANMGSVQAVIAKSDVVNAVKSDNKTASQYSQMMGY